MVSLVIYVYILYYIILLVRRNDSFRGDLCFAANVFFIYSTRDLRDASADRCEILHGDQY